MAHKPKIVADTESAGRSPRVLRLAFAAFAVDHAASSIARVWSTWNQFFTASRTRQAARANRTYRVLERITPAKQPANRAC